jgi:hypothetical protein
VVQPQQRGGVVDVGGGQGGEQVSHGVGSPVAGK